MQGIPDGERKIKKRDMRINSSCLFFVWIIKKTVDGGVKIQKYFVYHSFTGGMHMADWKKIKAEYIRNKTSYRKLAEKYGVSFSTLRRVAAKEKWTELRTQADAKRDTKLLESIADKEAKTEEKMRSVTDLLVEKIYEGVKDGSYISNAKNVHEITGALKDIREIKGMKSELDAQEQMARIEKLRKEAQKDDDDGDNVVVIEFEGDVSQYAK